MTGAAHPGTELQVLQSAGGYYLGFLNRDGAPYSRETEYLTYNEAVAVYEMVRYAGDLSIDVVAVPV